MNAYTALHKGKPHLS